MTEQSGMSRRQILRYGGLVAAAPLLPSVRPARKATPGRSTSVRRQVTPPALSPAVAEADYVRVGRSGRGSHMRCQLQFPSIRDHIDLDGDASHTGNIISEGSHGE